MSVFITGGTGFVGSHICRQLMAAGKNVRLLVRNKDKASAFYTKMGEGVPELVVGDITDIESVKRAMAGCTSVVHAAAATPIKTDSIEQLFKINVEGLKHVVDTALSFDIKSIVCISSITAIFNPDPNKVTADAMPVASKMPYGQSKVQGEIYLRELQAQGAPISIVYPGGIIGPDDPGFSDTFFALKHRIDNGFRIFGDGGMQHIDVRDLAAFICALSIDGGHGRFLLPGVYVRWTEFADIIEAVSGCTLKRIPAQGWKLRMVGRVMDLVRLFKPIDSPISAETMRYATLWPNIKNTDELAKRGLALRSANDTFADAIRWMVAAGYLEQSQCPAIKLS